MFRLTMIGAAALLMTLTALGCAYEEHDYHEDCGPGFEQRYEHREYRRDQHHHRHRTHHDHHGHGHRHGGYRY